MKRIFTQLSVGFALLAGMLLATPHATAQESVFMPEMQLRASSELRAGKPQNLKNTDYVAKDINGKEYNIKEILSSGKAIMIDFSAVWCGPCWGLHSSGVLEKLYEKFGPNGNNKIELFWVGASSRCTVDKIKGKGETQGNWTQVNGKPVPYPLFADPNMANSIGIPISGFPTLVVIGPGDKWIECRGEVQTDDPDFKDFAKLLTLFMTENDKPAGLSFTGVTDLYQGETHTMRLSYSTVAPITSVNWTASEGLKLTKVKENEYSVTAEKLGTFEISATVANKNGEAKTSIAVTVSEPISTFPFFSPMDTKDVLDKGWRSIDHDGDGFGFDSYRGKGLMDRLGLNFNKPNVMPGAEKSFDFLISFGQFFPESFDGRYYNGHKINPKNELLSAPLVIPADAVAPTFSCFIADLFTDDKPDQLKVMVKELDGTTAEVLAPTSPKDGKWKLVSADLSAYKGKTIMISLIPVVNGASGIQVDQIRVTMDGTTSDVDAPTLNVETSLFPNPASEYLSVQTRIGSTIEIFTMEGAVVASSKALSESTTIAVSQLPRGYYVARITSPEGDMVARLIILE